MANYPLNKISFNKDAYERTIDTSFAQQPLPTPPATKTTSVEEFFTLYNALFYDIPVDGDTNSHTYLYRTSGEYAGLDNPTGQDVQVLLDEITILRQDLLTANQTILTLQTNIPISSSVSSSM
jgi:hypothetical protein